MKKILIIEDDKNLQEGLAFSLKLEKYEILTASTIKQSMEFLQSEKIDLILQIVIFQMEVDLIYARK